MQEYHLRVVFLVECRQNAKSRKCIIDWPTGFNSLLFEGKIARACQPPNIEMFMICHVSIFCQEEKKGSHATFPFFLYFCSKVQRYQFWIPRDDPFVIAVGVWLTEILMTKYYKSCYCLTLDATTTRSIKSTGLPLNNSWWNRKGPTTSSYERRFLLFFLNQQCNGKKSWSNYIKSNTVFENCPKSRI